MQILFILLIIHPSVIFFSKKLDEEVGSLSGVSCTVYSSP